MSTSFPTKKHHYLTRYLHQGNDRFFNEQYRLKHAYYFGLLEQGSGAAAGAARAD